MSEQFQKAKEFYTDHPELVVEAGQDVIDY